MSTITVTKKDDLIAIAADTLTVYGNTKESAEYIVNHQKIIEHQGSYIGVSGSASLGIAIEDFLSKTKKKIALAGTADIFRFGLLLHKKLKDEYFLLPDDEEDFESFRGDILIANRKGIFGLSAYRFVQEYVKFYANGSGAEYALGAMFAVYDDRDKTAEDIARIGVAAGAAFDDGTSLPMTFYSFKTKS